jgi:hypothetical protein
LVLFGVLVVPALAVLGWGAWVLAGNVFEAGHPFGDSRACPGSDTDLGTAVQQEQIWLPRVTNGMRYWTHEGDRGGKHGATFVAVFHTDRQALREYLKGLGIADPDQAAGPDEANEGSVMGEPMGEGWGCGLPENAPPSVSIPKSLGTNGQLWVAIEMGPHGRIAAEPEVVVSVDR